MDLEKAFDTVDYNLLLFNLEAHEFYNPFLSWICSFLKDRIQNIKYENFISDNIYVSSGVP